MLLTAKSISNINIDVLKSIYTETIEQMERDDIQELSPYFSSELRFVEDLRNFFQMQNATLFLWDVCGCPVAALRCEPYMDGALVSYLETRPEMRGQGYGKELLSAAVRYLCDQGVCRVYSHVSKRNKPSLSVHSSCGFRISSDSAKLLDGTVTRNYYTMLYECTAE